MDSKDINGKQVVEGDVLVRVQNFGRGMRDGKIVKIERQYKGSLTLEKYGSGWASNNFRLATEIEAIAYKEGIRNIKDIKNNDMKSYDKNRNTISEGDIIIREREDGVIPSPGMKNGQICKVTYSNEGNIKIEGSPDTWASAYFRLANPTEMKLFNQGLRNINDKPSSPILHIKAPAVDPYMSASSIEQGSVVLRIGESSLAHNMIEGKIYVVSRLVDGQTMKVEGNLVNISANFDKGNFRRAYIHEIVEFLVDNPELADKVRISTDMSASTIQDVVNARLKDRNQGSLWPEHVFNNISNNKTQNLDNYGKNGSAIKLSAITPTVAGGSKKRGNSISGRTGPLTIKSGHLRNRAASI